MDDLYREIIIEHYKNPGYRGHLDPHDLMFEDSNPLCGDHIEITLQVGADGKVTDARFDGHGCAISQASADLLIEAVIGKSLDEIKTLNKDLTILVVSHDLLVVSSYAKSIACVNKRLHYHNVVGTTAELMNAFYSCSVEEVCPVETVARGLHKNIFLDIPRHD